MEVLYNIIHIYGGNDNVSYRFAQSGECNYLISQELTAGCTSKEEIFKRLSDIQEEFAARKYVIMGYDKDSDKSYIMQAADTLSEAAVLAKKVWETDKLRTDINRELNGVPDIDWFELYKQESGNIDYSQRLAVFCGQHSAHTKGISFSVRFDEDVSTDVRDEIEKTLKKLSSEKQRKQHERE